MQNSIILSEMTLHQLRVLVDVSVKSQLDDFRKTLGHSKPNEELLTREDVCEFLKINLSTLWLWINKAIGSCKCYKKCVSLSCLKPLLK